MIAVLAAHEPSVRAQSHANLWSLPLGKACWALAAFQPFMPVVHFTCHPLKKLPIIFSVPQISPPLLLITLLASFLQCLISVTHLSVSEVPCTAISIRFFFILFFFLSLRLP